MDDSNNSVPDLPESVKRISTTSARNRSTSASANDENASRVRIEMKEYYPDVVSTSTGRIRFAFERQVFADLSVAMSVGKERFSIENIEPKKGHERHIFLDLLIRQDELGMHPSSFQLASQLTYELNSGSLSAMPSMRKAIRAEARHPPPSSTQQLGALGLLQSGGFFVDSKNIARVVSSRNDDASLASRGALATESGLDHEALRKALEDQEKELTLARKQRTERR